MRRSVVVTGYGAVTPYGVGRPCLIENLRSGRSAVRSMAADWEGLVNGLLCLLGAPVAQDIDFSVIPRKQRRSMGRGAMFAHLAADEALEHARFPRELLASGRVGAALGDTLASPEGLEAFFRCYLIDRDIRHVPAGGFFRVMGHSCAANLAANFGIRGRVLATPAACAAGAFAIGAGSELIRWGVQDAMLCGGAEELHPTTSAIFDIVGASSSHWNHEPDRSPAPFDQDRDGVVCGEGSGVLLLESEEHARRRGAPIRARLLGFAGVADGENMAQPGLDSMVRCIQAALDDAGLRPEDVDNVNAHATGTVQGDVAEAQAIAHVFGADTRVTALKGYLGHTLGASAAIESIAGLEMMVQGYALPTAKLRRLDPECAGVRHQRDLEACDIRCFVKSSFGFGGMNAVLIFGRGADGTD